MKSPTVAAILLGLSVPALLGAQQAPGQTAGTGVHFQSYRFEPALGADAATLLLVPLAYQHRFGSQWSADLYTAYAHGSVEADGQTFSLSGLVDTQLRVNWTAAPWAVLTLGVNLPTGKASHSSQEAIVASVLSTDMLGFREATWGMGLGLTSGVATAHRLGEWGLGFGGSYRLTGDFQPRADTALTYTPGDEVRLRALVDRTVGNGRLTGGLTFQHYTGDRLDGRDLFQAGNRWRLDASYVFRTSRAAIWTAHLANIWRERGDLTLAIVDHLGTVVGDTTFQTGRQTLLVAGLAGSVRLSPAFTVQPAADLRLQTREEAGGEGWLLSAGADLPARLTRNSEVVPRARLHFGQMGSEQGEMHPFWGGEAGLSLRWRSGR